MMVVERLAVGRWVLSLLFVCASAGRAAAQDDGESTFSDVSDIQAEPIPVLQNRAFEQSNELTIYVGMLPADPYYKGYAVSAGYTIHFDHDIAWEVAQFTWSFNLDSDLKEKVVQLALTTGDTAPEFPEISWMVASHLVFKPFYGKEAFFNTDVVHLEAFLQAGPAFLARTNTAGKFGYGLDLGVGVRLWLSRRQSLRIDVGELLYIVPPGSDQPTSFAQALHLHLGYSINLWDDAS